MQRKVVNKRIIGLGKDGADAMPGDLVEVTPEQMKAIGLTRLVEPSAEDAEREKAKKEAETPHVLVSSAPAVRLSPDECRPGQGPLDPAEDEPVPQGVTEMAAPMVETKPIEGVHFAPARKEKDGEKTDSKPPRSEPPRSEPPTPRSEPPSGFGRRER